MTDTEEDIAILQRLVPELAKVHTRGNEAARVTLEARAEILNQLVTLVGPALSAISSKMDFQLDGEPVLQWRAFRIFPTLYLRDTGEFVLRAVTGKPLPVAEVCKSFSLTEIARELADEVFSQVSGARSVRTEEMVRRAAAFRGVADILMMIERGPAR